MSIEHSLKINGEMIPIQYFCEARPPYNVWECSAFDIEFTYDATISFMLGKNPDYWQIQNDFVLEYVFETMKSFKREGLFLYCMDTELYYFRADGSVQMNDEKGIMK